jgi:outer membrane protein assembly factor BamD (BamD/ComL family)
MTRKWVKEELKKNPLEKVVIKAVTYTVENKNNVLIALVILIVIGLFAGMIIRNRIMEGKEAARLFAFAQNDFDRFNYQAAIDKLSNIENKFGRTSIIDQVLYLKGLAYYKKGNYEPAEKAFIKCISDHPKSKIISETRISLASVYEEAEQYMKAIQQYSGIPENDYLRPEALMGIARLHEIQGNTQEAIKAYTSLQSHYVNTYWGNFASKRLALLGVKMPKTKEFVPEIGIE